MAGFRIAKTPAERLGGGSYQPDGSEEGQCSHCRSSEPAHTAATDPESVVQSVEGERPEPAVANARTRLPGTQSKLEAVNSLVDGARPQRSFIAYPRYYVPSNLLGSLLVRNDRLVAAADTNDLGPLRVGYEPMAPFLNDLRYGVFKL